jgi:hypothetical protein
MELKDTQKISSLKFRTKFLSHLNFLNKMKVATFENFSSHSSSFGNIIPVFLYKNVSYNTTNFCLLENLPVRNVRVFVNV